MKIELAPDYPLTDDACKQATGQTLSHWIGAIEARPGAAGKRRDTVNGWLYSEMGKNIWWATTAWVEYERKNGIVQKDGRGEGYNICVTKKIVAPLDKVFRAWTSNEVEAWLGDAAKIAEDKSISDTNGNLLTALRVRENKDLRYRFQNPKVGDGTQVDVTFTDEGNGKVALMLLHNRLQTREEADGMRQAWGESFNRLKAHLEKEA